MLFFVWVEPVGTARVIRPSEDTGAALAHCAGGSNTHSEFLNKREGKIVMAYHSIVAAGIGAIGVLHVVCAFTTPPKALEPYVNWSGRKMRAVMSWVPEDVRVPATRLTVGACLIVAAASVLLR